LFRIGRTSFRATKRKRQYTQPLRQHHWLLVNIDAAKKEFDALKRLLPTGAPVLEALARERHAVLMKFSDGTMLSEVNSLDDPEQILRQILQGVKTAYVKAGIVNGDLSEFNILVEGDRIWIIDWPQYLPTSHSFADKLLERDIFNILNFFRRRFRVTCTLEDASFYVRGWRDRLPLFKA